MSNLKRWFRRLWDAYPKEPLLYICTHNGVTGVVRAEDYDDEVRRMRHLFRKKGWPVTPYGRDDKPLRPQVFPIFLFSDKKLPSVSDKKQPRDGHRTGTLSEMRAALKDCHLEERIFELPPVDLPHQMPAGYHGALELLTRNDFGSSFPGRYRLWNLEDARSYFKKKPF